MNCARGTYFRYTLIQDSDPLKPVNVYSAVKPLHIISKLLGLVPLGLKSMAFSPGHLNGSAGLIGTVGSVFYSIQSNSFS